MTEWLPWVLFAAGLIAGSLVVWFARSTDQRRIQVLQREANDARDTCARLDERLVAEQRASAERLAIYAEAERKFKETFAALSADALRNNNEQFLSLAKTELKNYQESAKSDLDARQKAIDQALRPVAETLKSFDDKVNELEKKRTSAYDMLSAQVKVLGTETTKLGRALRTPVVRGRWGEIQLKRVVEIAGMVKYCDFNEQPTVTTEDGRLRPDLVVRQPGGKTIVVDAKVPLEAYLNSLDASTDEERRSALEVHAGRVRAHMKKLAEKGYWQQFDHAPEFVVMFLPGEMLFSAALEADPGLIESGVAQKVIPASPTTLIALLRAVSYGWKQEAIALEAKQISELGSALYKRLGGMAGHFFKLGRNLKSSVDSYNEAIGSLENRVLVSARRLKDYTSLVTEEDVKDMEPVETTPRKLQAPEFVYVPDGLFPLPERQGADGETEESDGNRPAIADLSDSIPAPVLAETNTPASPKSPADPL